MTSPNPHYVLGQLANALTTAESHKRADVRERAVERAKRWTDVFRGMLSGALAIGTRTPVAGTPTWATLDVITGGFATGHLPAGGPLREHERAMLAKIPAAPDASDRARINSWFVGEDGFAELQQLLTTGRYRIDIPEEGALLVVAWLVREGFVDEARTLLDEIGPHFAQLRFYPRPSDAPRRKPGTVHLQNVRKTLHQLHDLDDSREVLTMREVIRVWHPLYDRAAALFMETMRDGWPCQVYPDDWNDRARVLLNEYEERRKQHHLAHSHERSSGNFAHLRLYLEKCIRDPQSLSGSDVGMIRSILNAIEAKRGLPGSERWRAVRASQEADAARPMPSELARVLMKRLEALPLDEPLDSIGDLGAGLPEEITARLYRSLQTSLQTLIDNDVISSAELLGRMAAQLTSHARSAGMPGDDAMRLYAALYEAFRNRRSLLLFDLESQIRLEELPWIGALNSHRTNAATDGSRALLDEIVTLAITRFPYTIFPNKLLQEIRALASGAGIAIPIVDELASDIFTGEFGVQFSSAAKQAAAMLRGSLYERYYRIPHDEVAAIRDEPPRDKRKATSPQFARLCERLAGVNDGQRWSVARNGTIIEQEQILTTHNLASLFAALNLDEKLRPQLGDLALACYLWLARNVAEEHPRLTTIKNAAYAWRQMVFFLSLAGRSAVEQFFQQAMSQRRDARVEALLADLRRCYFQAVPVEPFLGWTIGRHRVFGLRQTNAV